ncbi:MAG: TRAP-type C4-dicarboxylate transport system permease small subunit [Sulfitobacter sp.]
MAETPTFLIKVEKRLRVFAGLFATLGGIALFTLAGITIVSVFFRYVLRDPIFGIEDMSTMTMTIVVAASVVWAAANQGHVAVNVLPMAFGRNVSRWTDLVGRLITFGILSVATYGLSVKGSCGLPCGAITSNLSIPHPPFYFVLSAAMGFAALWVLMQILIGLVHFNGDDPNEVTD